MGFFQQIRTQRQRSRRPNRRSSVKFWRKLKKFQITKSRASHQFQTHFIQRNRKRRVLHDFRPLQSIDGVPGTLTRHARFFFSLLSRTVTHQHLRTRQTIFGGQKIIRQNGGNEKVKKCQPKKMIIRPPRNVHCVGRSKLQKRTWREIFQKKMFRIFFAF